ncbi:DUF2125 domain-containing protein [Rubellimicrobium sp. CFH 75288]|uniref:DUF2125 domain-containing protein n=1 Tax=Rubellimicrobium sp. CFH 75288 TaxID=2697034 RepID=UPI0014129606|nr:DUF2125 domain-containing protein [Rubellimicrobium sp. CFH 75288]NAZ38047.1 DUF2125 domain-containing protein [Rubellimicrobium sp. CFH 75288]
MIAPRFRRLGAASALALAASPALADLTAQQVFDDWLSGLNVYGEEGVTIGAQDYAAGVLTVRDIAFSFESEDGTVVAGRVPEVVMTENDDGTVTVTMSPEYPMTISAPADPEAGTGASEARLLFRQAGLAMTVSGEPGAMTYDLSADRFSLELDSLAEDGEAVPAEFLLALNDLEGTTVSTGLPGEDRGFDYDWEAGTLDLLLDIPDAETGGHVMLSGRVSDMALQILLDMPAAALDSPETALRDGLSMEGGYEYASASYLFEVADPDMGSLNGTVATGAGTLSFAASGEEVSYSSQVVSLALAATGDQLPFPIEASIADYSVDLLMPLAASDEPRPWALGLNLAGFALNEEIWQTFDPGGVLPRDPATLTLSLSGLATLFSDLTDPALAEAAEPPGQIDSVEIETLVLSLGGAEVTGSGAFTLDNTDLETMGGLPRPEGTAEFRLVGVNALLDNLAALGLLQPDQMLPARMMLGAFATAVGPDELTSRIEATAEGQILVNGQRIQ